MAFEKRYNPFVIEALEPRVLLSDTAGLNAVSPDVSRTNASSVSEISLIDSIQKDESHTIINDVNSVWQDIDVSSLELVTSLENESGSESAPDVPYSGSSSQEPHRLSRQSIASPEAAVRVWDGGGSDSLWSNPLNWINDVLPQQDDNLLFPTGVTNKTAINDFAAGSRFRSVTISDASYQISGNAITLLCGLVYNATGSGATFSLPIILGAAQTFFSANIDASITLGDLDLANLQLLTFEGRGNIDVEGTVTGTGGITKNGDGTLVLGKNNLFQGLVTLNQGTINLRANNALGSTDAGTIATYGTAIQLQGNITVPENMAIRSGGMGFSFSSMGAIRSVGGNNEITGVVSMLDHGSIGVDSGSTLKISGAIMVEPGVSDGGLTKFGAGSLEITGTADNAITGQTTVLQGTLYLNKDRSGIFQRV